MEIQTGALVIVLAYMVGMMIIGYVVGKINIKGSADYLVAGRRMGLFMVAFSLSANNIGGGSTTGLAQKAFGAWGVSAIYMKRYGVSCQKVIRNCWLLWQKPMTPKWKQYERL